MARKTMGYQNFNAAITNVLGQGKLTRPFRGNLSTDTTAALVLLYMCETSNDWPLTPKQKKNFYGTSRVYMRGLEDMAVSLGMIQLTPDQFWKKPDESMKRRKRAAITRIHNAIHTLEEKGIVKNLSGGFPGRNAAYLLLIGDEDENRDVEAYDLSVMGLA